MKANLEGIRFANDRRDGELLFDFDSMDFVDSACCVGAGSTMCPTLEFLACSGKQLGPLTYGLLGGVATIVVVVVEQEEEEKVALAELVFKMLEGFKEAEEIDNNGPSFKADVS